MFGIVLTGGLVWSFSFVEVVLVLRRRFSYSDVACLISAYIIITILLLSWTTLFTIKW